MGWGNHSDDDATTAATPPTGSPYVDIHLASLANGRATLLLDYADPSLTKIRSTPRLISGIP
jgi:hypothetical protein